MKIAQIFPESCDFCKNLTGNLGYLVQTALIGKQYNFNALLFTFWL